MPRVGSRATLAEYLRSRVGQVLDADELQEAAGGATEWARRLRELRASGWSISSNNDRNDLKPGQYVLEAEPPDKGEYVFERPISGTTRARVLERNGYTCQMCGASAGDADELNPGRKIRLHIGHITDRSHGGDDSEHNLRALCSTCNQGAKNLTIEPPRHRWLLAQVRRANMDDQKKILKWLKKRFNEE